MNVNEILKETIAMVEALGIEVGDIEPTIKINTRAKSIWVDVVTKVRQRNIR